MNNNRKITLLIFVILLFCNNLAHSQNWQKYYGSGGYWLCASYESYDKGIYFLNSNYDISILNKADINGNILWQRNIGNYADSIQVTDMHPTKDGGTIMSAAKYIYVNGDYLSDIYLIKLNACGQLDWCKVYAPQKGGGNVTKVIELANGDFVFYYNFGGLTKDYQCWLFCTDTLGNIKWQVYTIIDMYDLYQDNNGFLIVSGFAYLPTIQNRQWLLPPFILAKFDNKGNQVWMQPYSVAKEIYGSIYGTAAMPDAGYLSSGSRDNNGKGTAYLIKSDSSGNVLWAKDFGDTSLDENPSAICKIDNNSYMIALRLNTPNNNSDDYHLEMVKVDGNGNILKQLYYPSNQYYLVNYQIQPTSDSKFLVSGTCNAINGGSGTSFIYKMNADMEIDSFYHLNIKYDYKCTDTLAKTGTIWVDHADTIHVIIPTYNAIKPDNSTSSNINFYPNPARDYVMVSGTGFGFGIVECSLYNIVGQKLNTLQFISNPDGQLNAEISTAGLAKGIYILEVGQGSNRCIQKFVVE